MMKKDRLDVWLENNTGKYGIPTPYNERAIQSRDAFDQQVQAISVRKRYVYQMWCLQQDDNGYQEEWMSIGEHEVNNKEELNNLRIKLENKYKTDIRMDLVKSNW